MVLAVSIVGLGGTASDVSEGPTSSPTGRDPHRPTEARECWLEKCAIKGYGFLIIVKLSTAQRKTAWSSNHDLRVHFIPELLERILMTEFCC